MTILENRLRHRATDSEEQIEKRLMAAMEEIEQATGYTHWIVNDDLDKAALELRAIVSAERIKRRDRDGLIKAVLES